MEDIKNTFLKIAVIVLILVIPISLFSAALEWTLNAIKWIVFIDNAETGLSQSAETIIKAICEAIITAIAVGLGISQKNPFVSILAILVGFLACIGIYAICKYIVWIVVGLAVLFACFLAFSIIRAKREKKQEKNLPSKEI